MAGKTLEGCRILVAEDEYYLADELRWELTDAGAIVLGPVGAVEDALELIDADPAIDAAVIDLNLRGVKAYPVADRLAQRGIRFLFVTGYDRSAILPQYQDVTRCEKPVDVGRVTAAIAQALQAA